MKITKTTLVGVFFCGMQMMLADGRSFEDKYGRTIDAELVSHTGATSKTVKINKGGREMEAPIANFSTKDQKFIRDWMAKTPPTIAYAFRVETDKRVVDSARTKNYSSRGKSETKVFDIKITNLTRQTVSGIRMEYKAFMRNHGGPSSSGSYYYAASSSTLESVTDSLKIPGELAYNRSAKITTKSLQIDSRRSSYSSYNFSDELLGVIVRVYDPQDKMITEWRTPNRGFEKIPWNSRGGSSGSSKVTVE